MKQMGQNNSIQVYLANQSKLYNKFKEVCKTSNISIKTGIHEAIVMWLHHEMGDRDFTRYMASEEIRKGLIAQVRRLRLAKTASEARQILDTILKEY